MKQAIMLTPGEMRFVDVSEPEILNDHDVLLKIRRIGICGSDVHTYRGEHPAVEYPVVQGHEYSGIVEAVGRGVKTVHPGMMVTARPQLVCGTCAPCLRGEYNVCENLRVEGFQAPGVAQEFFVVTEDRVVPFPDSISLDQGAMIEPTAVAAHATERVDSFVEKNVIVTGAGTIGNLTAQYAKIRGANKVLITDISNYRLNIARKCGVEHTLNVLEESFEDKISEVFGDKGFQIGLEAAGVQSSLDSLLKYIEKGSDIIIIAVYSENPVVNMFYLGEHELKLTGSLMYRHEDYLEAVDAIASGKIQLQPLISKHFRFDEYDDGYQYIFDQKDEVMKVLIDLDDL